MNVRYWVFVFSFDVGRSMFDVERSFFKTISYSINVNRERLLNSLALMGAAPTAKIRDEEARG